MKLTTPVLLVLTTTALTTGVASASGADLLLGRDNTASATTVLRTTSGAPLTLVAPSGTAPLRVSSATVVRYLNADRLDGLSSEHFQRRVQASCPAGQAVRGLTAAGHPVCAWVDVPGTLQVRPASGTTTDRQQLAHQEGVASLSVERVGSACGLKVTNLGRYPIAVNTSNPLNRQMVDTGASATTAAATTQLQTISWPGGGATVFLTWIPSASGCGFQGTVTS